MILIKQINLYCFNLNIDSQTNQIGALHRRKLARADFKLFIGSARILGSVAGNAEQFLQRERADRFRVRARSLQVILIYISF